MEISGFAPCSPMCATSLVQGFWSLGPPITATLVRKSGKESCEFPDGDGAEISAETHPFATAHVQLRHVYSQVATCHMVTGTELLAGWRAEYALGWGVRGSSRRAANTTASTYCRICWTS